MTDLRVAFRQLAARPGSTVIVVVTPALGIGAATAMCDAPRMAPGAAALLPAGRATTLDPVEALRHE